MEEIRKKKKNYYNHNNQYNRNNYYNRKKRKEKKVLLDDEMLDENVLLQKEDSIIKEEPVKNDINDNIEIQEDVEYIPIKKKENIFKSKLSSLKNIFSFKKQNMLKFAGVFILLIAIVGTSYSFFSYYKEDSRQADIIAGEIYVKLVENEANLTLNRMYPRTIEEARSRNDNYIDFTIKGKNTSTNKVAYYEININNGEDVNGKVRIDPKYILFDLQEKVNGEYEYIKEAISYTSFNFKDFIPENTTSEMTKEYRLRMWISDEIIISDTEENASYTQAEFANLYANVNVSVNAYDGNPPRPAHETVREAITAKINAETNSCNPIWVDNMDTANDETDDITYFSGTNDCVDMNYVWYSGKLWRITAIYPDGAMKLVTQNNITTIAFNASGQVNFYTDENTTSYMYQWLNEDFYDTLYNGEEFIDTTKLWNATNSNASSTSEISTRLLETTMVSSNVGLLNSYEYYNSYRNIGSASYGYLNIKYSWWILNPYNASDVWYVNYSGDGYSYYPTNTYGARPSFYLKSGLEFTGSGTPSDPYKIKGDKEKGNPNDLINTRLSGEYVKLVNNDSNQMFRIIGVEDNKTKIISMDYADNKGRKKFATSTDNLWGSGTTTEDGTWYTYLNTPETGYYAVLQSTYGDLFDSATYYLGTSSYNYKLSVCANTTSGNTSVCDKTSQNGTFNIGLPRYGEIFATQQAGGYSNSIGMWLMNRYSTSVVWVVYNNGYGYYSGPASSDGGRPTLHLKSSVKIISGTGIESDPYVVGL